MTSDLVTFLGNMAKRTEPGFVNYRTWWFCVNNLYKDTFCKFYTFIARKFGTEADAGQRKI